MSKGRAVAQKQAVMGDKPKSAKKRFRFRGGGKKENGMIPSATSGNDPPEDGPCVGVVPSLSPVGATGAHKVYQLSNSDIINGAANVGGSSASQGHEELSPACRGEQLICTCPVSPTEMGSPSKQSVTNTASQYSEMTNHREVSTNGCSSQPDDNRDGCSDVGNHANKVSVVAVIESGRSPDETPEQTSSNNSTSSTSICSVRAKIPTTMPSTDALLSEIMCASPQRPLVSHGDRSPSSHSLVSVASSTITIDAPADSPFGPRFGSERQKQTLGEIVHQIETKCKSLLSVDDFTVPDPYPDLQFLSHQSRYNSDVHIKRRLINKLVDCGVVDIFLRVFHSVHAVDYLGAASEDGVLLGARSTSQMLHEQKLDTRSLNDGASGVQVAPPDDSAAAGEPACGQAGDEVTKQDARSLAGEEDCSLHVNSTKEFVGCPVPSASPAMPSASPSVPSTSPNVPLDSSAMPSGSPAVPLVCPALKNLRSAVTLMWNTSDKSPILCEKCIKKGVVQLLLNALGDRNLAASELHDQQRLYLVKGYLGILNNIVCFFNDARDIFREAGAVKTLQTYLRSQLLLVKTKTIMLLSYLISESENDIINASNKNIGFMIKMLDATLEKDNHYSRKFTFWAVEVAAGLNRLGCFEANKDRIVEQGVLPLYLELIQKSCNEDERLLAAQGLWIFSYSDKARNLIQDDAQLMSALHRLRETACRDEVKRAAAGALWIVEERPLGIGAVPKSPKLAAGAGHIYISYHWTAVQFVSRLRDKLRSFGYKVFVDTENMGTCGLPLETVFEGIEKACVLILCMSQRYKDSPSCRNDVEHALRLRRDIIPLRLQQKYNPDGWLASVTNTRLIFDFSRDENLENVTMALIRELGSRGKSKSSLAAAAAAASVVSVEQSGASRSPSNQSVALGSQNVNTTNDPVASRVSHWNESDVAHWLMENGLTSAIDSFHSINGELLHEMRKMHEMAPESFFLMLRSELGFDWITQLKFTKALDKL